MITSNMVNTPNENVNESVNYSSDTGIFITGGITSVHDHLAFSYAKTASRFLAPTIWAKAFFFIFFTKK